MAKTSSKFGSESTTKQNSNTTPTGETVDDTDVDLNEYFPFPIENEKASKKMVARRKVEMLWEKKRLKEELGGYDDYDDYDSYDEDD